MEPVTFAPITPICCPSFYDMWRPENGNGHGSLDRIAPAFVAQPPVGYEYLTLAPVYGNGNIEPNGLEWTGSAAMPGIRWYRHHACPLSVAVG